MKEEAHLAERVSGEVERWLLDSAREDCPSPDAKLRTLSALGLASAPNGHVGDGHGADGVASGAGTGAPAGAPGAAPPSGLAGTLGGIGLAKWIAGLGVAGVLAAGAYGGRDEQPFRRGDALAAHSVETRETGRLVSEERRSEPAPVATVEAIAGDASSRPKPSAAAVSRHRAVPKGVARPVAPPVAVAVEEPRESPAVTSTVLDEVASLDVARSALRRGQIDEALAALSGFERRFPNARLSPEARVLRIQALSRAGRLAEAEREAKLFLSADPRSPHAERVRQIIRRP